MKTTIIILVVLGCVASAYALPLQQSPEIINNSYGKPGFFETIAGKSCDNEPMHRHPDMDEFPGYVCHRIKAWLKSGEAVYSEISMVRIIKKGNKARK